jgi:hypothetical protein
MPKRLKTAAELAALINAELSKHQFCKDTGVEGVELIVDERVDHNWTCKFLRRSGNPPSPDCQQILAAVVRELQQRYDLAPEE